jgi:hypothetical protein
MANALFDLARASFLKAEINIPTDNIKAVLVDHGTDTPVIATDQFLSDIAAGARVATSANFTTKTTTAGVFDADDITFTAVSGATVESLVIYQDTGVAATSRLIAYIDTLGVGTFPITPNGGDISFVWDNGANKIFKL